MECQEVLPPDIPAIEVWPDTRNWRRIAICIGGNNVFPQCPRNIPRIPKPVSRSPPPLQSSYVLPCEFQVDPKDLVMTKVSSSSFDFRSEEHTSELQSLR